MISGTTRLFAILADPVGHVRTPQALNARFAEAGQDAVLVPCEVGPDALEETVRGLRNVRNLGGLVVTVPHKTEIARHCNALSERARLAGAVNVVRREADGRLFGDLLDGAGFVAGLSAAEVELEGRSVFLAGAGGAASAIAFALAEAGAARLTVANRSEAKARALLQRLQSAFPAVAVEAGHDPQRHDIAVNATSLGLKPDDPLPFDPADLSPGTLVAEVIMQPEETPLLAAAAARGLPTHLGRMMLEGQLRQMMAFLLPEAEGAA
ncbi:shikimate dehydrogenase family protein [Limimaricola pyoseonensis]|uniref:shikimate dehydrogenase (NADP(+)) n=1 Tax=Limimaricola pyoseonensis TaxID=521013 RepID=A0A1G7HHD2_9RHOB|nr:shikimate dehydrogenase [Limimaricola pyoseonensis]SDE99917.1 shikimate dehydrogenase [Limimaricola pyoseonensis]